MVTRCAVAALLCSLTLAADSVELRSGKVVEGTYLGGDSRRVRMAVGDDVQSFGVDEIVSIRFVSPKASVSSRSSSASSSSSSSSSTASTPSAATSAAPVASTPRRLEVPAGTALVIRMIDDVDSARDKAGQTFRASMDEPVIIDGRTVIPKGADVVAKLIEDKQAGKLTGRSELTMDLQSVVIDGKAIDVLTGEVTQRGESRTQQTAVRSGGAAALGAVIGAIAGGGKGAAIGAVTGAAAGGAVQVMTKGPTVRIPSETRLTFTLSNPLAL